MDVLLDINIIVDLLLKRDGYRDAKRIYAIASLFSSKMWMAASSVDNLYYVLHSEAKRIKHLANEKCADEDSKEVDNLFYNFMDKVSIFSVEPKSIRRALSNYKDMENTIIYNNFKRIAPAGLIISKDKYFLELPDVISPDEFIKKYSDSITQPFNITSSNFVHFLDLQEEYRYMLEEIDEAVLNSIAEAKYILGPQVEKLEGKIASYLNVKHCIGVSSGTEALVLSLRAIAIKLKDKEYFDKTEEIITTPFTFTATGDAILRAGATPVFVDIVPSTYNLDPAKIKEYLISHTSSRVVGIIPVHLYGQACRMDEIIEIAKEYNLFVLEDDAQSFGGMWKDKKLGVLGMAGAFSFFPSKNLGGFGDGGMVSTNDDEIAELVHMLLKHGGKNKYNVDHIGYNARLDTLQAAILLAKFKYIDNLNERRRKIAGIYNRELSSIEDLILPVPSHSLSITSHVYHQYTVRVLKGKRDALQTHLKGKGVPTMIYYPVPLHMMKVFEGRSKIFENLKESERAVMEVLSLPIEPLMGIEAVMLVVREIKSFFAES